MQCDQIGRFIALWVTFQSLWQQLFTKTAYILGNFCKVIEIFHFSSRHHFWATFIDIGPLFTGHTAPM